MTDMKMQDRKLTDQFARHEIPGREKQDRKLAQKRQKRLRLNRLSNLLGLLLLRLEECRRSKQSGLNSPAWLMPHQTAEEKNESDERATHQNVRFTVRLRIVDAHSVPTRRESQRRRAHWRYLQPRHNESSSEDDADDLLSATTLPAAATGTTSTSTVTPAAAADNCCEVCLIGQPDGVTLSAILLSTELSVWAPAVRFVALISKWWCASITKHCGYCNECSCFKMTLTYFCAFVCDCVIFSSAST